MLVCRALADMNNDGRMDQVEFSIAMKLIKLKLQGYQLPSSLPPVMKQQPVAISSTPAFGKSEMDLVPIFHVDLKNTFSSFSPFLFVALWYSRRQFGPKNDGPGPVQADNAGGEDHVHI